MKKTAQILFILVFVGSLFAVPLAIFTRGKDNTVAYYENRALQTISDYTLEELAQGVYGEEVELWLSDHMPLRESLVQSTIWWDMDVLDQPVVKDIVITEDVLLPYNAFGVWDLAYLEPMAQTAVENHLPIVDLLETWGGTFLYVGIPLQNTYFASAYPDYTASRDWHIQAMSDLFETQAEAQDMPFLNMTTVFADMGNPEELYAKTDHHYTYFGAYATYSAIMDTLNDQTGLNLPVLGADDITIEPVDTPFLGSRNREIYGLWTGVESFYIGTQTQMVDFVRYDNGVEVVAELYRFADTAMVTYDAYMGGDVAETWIQTNRADLPNLLIFGDSFTNPLETMLYTGFNETRSLDLRYYTEQGILDYIAAYQPDVVLCIRDDHSYLLTVGNGNIA